MIGEIVEFLAVLDEVAIRAKKEFIYLALFRGIPPGYDFIMNNLRGFVCLLEGGDTRVASTGFTRPRVSGGDRL